MTPEERYEFVSELIGGFKAAGLNYEEIKEAVAFVADTHAHEPKLAGEFFRKEGNGLLTYIGSSAPVRAVGSAVTGAASKALGAGTDVMGRIAGGTVMASPLMLGAGLAVPYAAMYGAGHLAGSVTDDPEDALEEIRYQEKLDALRRSAARIQRHRDMHG